MQSKDKAINKYQATAEDAQLPLEILCIIFTYLERQDLLRSMKVNRTWYHLITENKSLINSYLNQAIAKKISLDFKTRQKLKSYTFDQLIKLKKIANDTVPNTLLRRTQITSKQQLESENILRLLKETLHFTLEATIWPKQILGTPTLPKFGAYLFFLCVVASLIISDPDASFLKILLTSPLILSSSLFEDSRYIIPLVFFSSIFAARFYNDFNNAQQIYNTNLLNKINDDSILNQVSLQKTIQAPASLITISWKRSPVFSQQKYTEGELSLSDSIDDMDLASKKNN